MKKLLLLNSEEPAGLCDLETGNCIPASPQATISAEPTILTPPQPVDSLEDAPTA